MSDKFFNWYYKIATTKTTKLEEGGKNNHKLKLTTENEDRISIAEAIYFILGVIGLIAFYILIFFTPLGELSDWKIWTLFIPLLIWLIIKDNNNNLIGKFLYIIFLGAVSGGILYLIVKLVN